MNDPVLYTRSNPFQARDASLVLSACLKDLNEPSDNENVLDIGCGSGNVTSQILAPSCRRYGKIVGVDISTEMVKYARQKFSNGNISFEVLDIGGNVQNFRNVWGGFSKIFSFYCLHWVKNHKKVVENIKYLLNTGGECLLVFVAQCPVFEMYKRVAENSKWKEYMKDVDNFIPSTQNSPQPAFQFSQLVEDVGLQMINCETWNQEFAFSSMTMLKDCMSVVNPFIERIPAEDKASFITECLVTLASMKGNGGNANENGVHNFSYKLLVAHAKKPASAC